MQKRSKSGGAILFEPIDFDPGLLVRLNPHSDPDSPMERVHYHDAVEVSLCTQGCGVFFIEEAVFPYREGTLVFLPAGTVHASHGELGERSKWVTLYVDQASRSGEVLEDSDAFSTSPGVYVLDAFEHPRLADCIDGIFRECARNDTLSREGIQGYLQVLFVELSRTAQPANFHSKQPRSSLTRMAPVIDYIAAKLGTPVRVGELARQAGMSQSSFRRAFLGCMHQTPHQYVLRTRIQLAKSLLHDPSLSVLEIASRCGFVTLSTFNRAFRNISGMSPRDWRRTDFH